MGHAAGWIVPLAWLITNERIRDYGCNAERAAAEYFSKACAPGVLSSFFQVTLPYLVVNILSLLNACKSGSRPRKFLGIQPFVRFVPRLCLRLLQKEPHGGLLWSYGSFQVLIWNHSFCMLQSSMRIFRCLVEGGGHVAFVKHTTVMENCDGRRKEWWARNQVIVMTVQPL